MTASDDAWLWFGLVAIAGFMALTLVGPRLGIPVAWQLVGALIVVSALVGEALNRAEVFGRGT